MVFRVGMKVVCVGAKWRSRGWQFVKNKPVRGGIYTIRDISDWRGDGETYFLLEEIVNAPVNWYDGHGEAQFCAERFRPIVERKTSIEIFTRMLNPSKVDA